MRREISRMMKPSHYQTYVDVYVGTHMDEGDRVTLRTICVIVEFQDEPVPELRETLTRTSEVRRPPSLDFYWGSVTEFLSRLHPTDLVREVVDLKVVPTYGNILLDVDRIMREAEVGKRVATHKLMTALSLMDLRGSRPPTRVIRWMSRTLKEATTTKDRITFWAGAATLYPLEDLLGVEATTGLRETVAHLAEHPVRVGWR